MAEKAGKPGNKGYQEAMIPAELLLAPMGMSSKHVLVVPGNEANMSPTLLVSTDRNNRTVVESLMCEVT